MSKKDLIFSNFSIEKVENGFFFLEKPLPIDYVLEKISSIDGEPQTIFPYEVGGYVLWLLIK